MLGQLNAVGKSCGSGECVLMAVQIGVKRHPPELGIISSTQNRDGVLRVSRKPSQKMLRHCNYSTISHISHLFAIQFHICTRPWPKKRATMMLSRIQHSSSRCEVETGCIICDVPSCWSRSCPCKGAPDPFHNSSSGCLLWCCIAALGCCAVCAAGLWAD